MKKLLHKKLIIPALAVVIFFSTTAFKNDSVYRDPKINRLESHERKTKVDHWGRFQLDHQ